MEAFKEALKKKTVTTLNQMHFRAMGYEKSLIESVLISKMYPEKKK